ncbi:hypothetical protein PSTT_06110 [Puccinia striiformis]|uniref:Uncharacterized protein n=2 Tax=Puccinia striiformis TaxID=27350 RepID=A0A0L0UY97_9BASI|nr:hypothetical protein PSTG_14601 [Puccinia striiformis f. sp. tritici PST-78]POW10474.1 hypothetical protein PSTT_06110 [Puccinia striiformis]
MESSGLHATADGLNVTEARCETGYQRAAAPVMWPLDSDPSGHFARGALSSWAIAQDPRSTDTITHKMTVKQPVMEGGPGLFRHIGCDMFLKTNRRRQFQTCLELLTKRLFWAAHQCCVAKKWTTAWKAQQSIMIIHKSAFKPAPNRTVRSIVRTGGWALIPTGPPSSHCGGIQREGEAHLLDRRPFDPIDTKGHQSYWVAQRLSIVPAG